MRSTNISRLIYQSYDCVNYQKDMANTESQK